MACNSHRPPTPEIISVDEECSDPDAGKGGKTQFVFTWSIKNFSSCQVDCGDPLPGPIFSVDSSVRWYVALYPNGQQDFEDYVSIEIVRLSTESDGPAEEERVYCKVSVLDARSESWHSAVNEQDPVFLGRIKFDDFVTKSRLMENKSIVLPDDTLTLRCRICAYDQTHLGSTTSSSETPPSHTRLRNFSNDFKTLYKSGKFSDVSLVMRDGSISAHKVILSARSSVFSRLLDSSESPTQISVPEFEKSTMDALLSYIYTGEIDHTSTVLPLELYEAAKKYEVRDLTRSITPNEIYARTEVIKEQYSFTWHLKNFSSINTNSGRGIYSHKFHTGLTGMWSLSLHFRGSTDDEEDETVGIYLNKLWSSDVKKPVFVEFEIHVLDKDERRCFSFKMGKCYKQSNRFGSPSFLRRSDLLEERGRFLPGDTLSICCDMKVSGSSHLSQIQKSNSSSITNLLEINDVTSLSDCFRDLITRGGNSDVDIQCPDQKKFSLHKAILCARSSVFSDFFEKIEKRNFEKIEKDKNAKKPVIPVININEVKSETLFVLFLFIYTGEMVDMTCDTAPAVYAAANFYKIAETNVIFSNFLLSNLSINNAFKMMALGLSMEDESLTTLVKDFICSHAEQLLNNSQWPNFAKDHPECACEIIKCLADVYRESKRRRLN